MSGNPRKRRSMWDNKEENHITSQTSEQSAWQERESYPRYDRKLSDDDTDYALKSKEFHEGTNREPLPSGGQRDSKRDLYDISHRRSGDVAKRYTVSPPEHGSGQQNHILSPEGTRDPPHRRSRSRSRSRGKGSRGRSRSPSRGRNNRSRSLSRGRERVVVYGRSRTPPNDYNRRDQHTFGDRRRGFADPPPQVCRNFTAGSCMRGSQCRFLHPINGARSERDQLERQGTRGERVGSRYELDREELMRNLKTNVCNNFLMGRCRMGSLCRYSHHDAGGGDNNHERERQPPPVAPCKFFLRGNCSRSNCHFSHDNAPTHNNREFEQHNDRRDRDYGDITERRDHNLDVKDGGGSTWHDERNKDDMHNRSKKWGASRDGDGMGMEFIGSEAANEINKTDPDYRKPYEISASLDSLGLQQPTSILAHSVIPETSQLYNNAERNISMALGFGSVNSANAIEDIPIPGQNFNQNSDSFGPPLQQFGGNSQDRDQLIGSLKPCDGNNIDFSGQVQANISPFKAQNSIDTQYRPPVINHSLSQRIDDQSVHISNLPASLTEKFVNEQLPQLYAVLNPPKPDEPMLSVPNLMNNQVDQISIYQKRDHGDIEGRIPDNSNQYSESFSHTIAQNGASTNSNHMNSLPNQSKTSPKSAPKVPSKPITEKNNESLENNGPRNVESDVKIGHGPNWKDEKAMRLFKNSLVEFVKDILKPKWKEGQMTRDIHKSIVKKVVDKVTNATQGINIPSTQAKLDQYLQTSKPKLAKLVEAYLERSAKAS